jgi:hypothetical protein
MKDQGLCVNPGFPAPKAEAAGQTTNMSAEVLSIIAIILSAVSLGWQVIVFSLSGPIVRVRAFMAIGSEEPSVITVSVTVINKGRSPAALVSKRVRVDYHYTALDGHSLAGKHIPRTATGNPQSPGY